MDTSPQAGQGPAASALPAKCIACNRELHSAAVCDYCHTLNPISAPTDYFQLLGVDRRFDLDADELRRKYLALNRHAHPDFHTAETPEVRELSLNISSAVNDAYRTLRDPISRAEYLLEVLGGSSSASDKSTPDGFLAEMMELQEQVNEAAAGGDKAASAAPGGGVPSVRPCRAGASPSASRTSGAAAESAGRLKTLHGARGAVGSASRISTSSHSA